MSPPSPLDRPQSAVSGRIARRGRIVWLLVGVAVACALRADSFFLGRGIDPDEGLSLMLGRALCQGWLPYTRYFDHRGPLMYANFAAAQLLFGDHAAACRIWTAVLVGATAACCGAIARRLLNDRGAGLAAMLAVAFGSSMASGITAASELLVAPWTALAVWLALVAGKRAGARRVALAALAGLTLGVGVQVKLLAVLETPAALVALAIAGRRAAIRELLAPAAALVGAIALPTLAVGATYAFGGHWDRFVYCCFTFNRAYAASVAFDGRAFVAFLGFAGRSLLWLAPAAALAFVGWRDAARRRAMTLAVVWLAVEFAAACATKRFFEHYLLTTLPAIGLVAALGWSATRRLSTAARRVAFGALAAGAIFGVYERIARLPALIADERETATLAAYLIRARPPGEVVFLANNDPIFYYFARSEPATAYFFPMWIGRAEWRAAFGIDYQRVLREALARRPSLVAIRKSRGGWEPQVIRALQRLLRADYELRRETPRVLIYSPKDPTTAATTNATSRPADDDR